MKGNHTSNMSERSFECDCGHPRSISERAVSPYEQASEVIFGHFLCQFSLDKLHTNIIQNEVSLQYSNILAEYSPY